LNSFFWRQVVGNSPDEPVSNKDYELGWNAINELIRADGTWSGYERNVFYANNRNGTFSDISAVAGLDFLEDGRAFALADFDSDGRLEIVVKNRDAPQLRMLKNVIDDLPPSISFRLQGTKSNRDAIGASVTVEAGALKQTRMLQAGSAFLAQHSKDVCFGLGGVKGPVRASIRWPSGLVQELADLPINHRIWVEEGKQPSRAQPFRRTLARESSAQKSGGVLPTEVETWLLAPVPAPDFSLADLSGQLRSLSALRGKPVVLYLWTTNAPVCQADLKTFEKNYSRWFAQGLHLLAINVDNSLAAAADQKQSALQSTLESFARANRFSFPVVPASEDTAAVYNIVYRELFGRHRDLSLPTSFLIGGDGYIAKVYQGAVDPAHVEQDFQHIPSTDAERLARGLPFPTSKFTLAFGRNHLASGSLFFQRGYLDQAEVSF
jgi:peroxiredoxin